MASHRVGHRDGHDSVRRCRRASSGSRATRSVAHPRLRAQRAAGRHRAARAEADARHPRRPATVVALDPDCARGGGARLAAALVVSPSPAAKAASRSGRCTAIRRERVRARRTDGPARGRGARALRRADGRGAARLFRAARAGRCVLADEHGARAVLEVASRAPRAAAGQPARRGRPGEVRPPRGHRRARAGVGAGSANDRTGRGEGGDTPDRRRTAEKAA